MTIQNTLTATLDEIVFEGRNKAYGAFVLRRLYDRHLATAMGLAALLCLLLAIVPSLLQHFAPSTVGSSSQPIPVATDLLYIAQPTAPQPVAPPARTLAPAAPTTKAPAAATATRVVADAKFRPEQTDQPAVTTTAVPGAVAGTTEQPGVVGGLPGGVGSPEGTETGASAGATAPAASTEPFIHVEVMPEFAGGTEALRRYLQRNLHYPKEALHNGVSGKVFITFVVNADGSISNVEVLKGLGAGTDEEAARVVRAMPAWKPGRQNNHAVTVRYTLPITFRYE